MKFRKIWALGLAVVLGAGVVAGCGSEQASTDKKTITYSKSQGPYSELFENGVKPILEK